MERSHRLQTKDRNAIVFAFIMMLALAFFQCFKTTHDLHWAADVDFDRDISFVQGTLDGHYGKDPSYAGEYLWYNPLLFSVETVLVKATGLPVHDVVTQAGTWLNILAPIAFFIMTALTTDLAIALASTLAFLFLANGNILGWGSATYSPWLYPVCFAQWLFYIDILFCYKAFSTGKGSWFAALGGTTGLLFLGHAAPAVIMVLLVALLQAGNLFTAIREKDNATTSRLVVQSSLTLLAFLIASLPLTWYVIGKYHLHSINREAFEYAEGIFVPRNFIAMIKANLSVTFFVSLIGFAWVWKNIRSTLFGKMLLYWAGLSILLYTYSTMVAMLDYKYHIKLPGTVPSFHYFFYLKAAESLFFGFGFVYLFRLAFPRRHGPALASATLLCAIAYFPIYRNRDDFSQLRKAALYKEDQKDKIATYHYILENIPAEDVILCPADSTSLFPVMATGRKMVSTAFTFSNPYVDFLQRENDRNTMVQYLCTGRPLQARHIFRNYGVEFALLPNTMLTPTKDSLLLPGKQVYHNTTYTLFSLDSSLLYSAGQTTLPQSTDKSKL